ncbi:MAG: transketolase [Planctomycetales bacterium]
MMPISTNQSIQQLAINTIRTLSIDGVQAANSGHPGTPMALAPVCYYLWNETLRFDPSRPAWPGRDRFVLSCGHASMLLYSLLHLTGVEEVDECGSPVGRPAISLDQIRNFRQLHSPCAGHPEFGHASGIETTTGPLGQGIATSVGMAISARWRQMHFARPGFDMFGFNTYAVCSDGDMMEGIGAEAASLAGHLKLSNLCWIYDDNHITIEGETSLAFSEDIATRFEGLGWQVQLVEDANDLESFSRALNAFQSNDDCPTLIIVRSVIGYGSPNKANSHSAHGAPLGAVEVRLTKQAYGWPEDEQFLVPDEVRSHFADGIGVRGRQECDRWEEQFNDYAQANPDLARQWQTMQSHELPDGWEEAIPVFETDEKGMATRVVSGKVLNALAAKIPWLLGGSADLAPSTMTHLTEEDDFSSNSFGRNFHFGIREHAMAAACNGMAISKLRPFGATFFVFTDYMRPSMRLSAIMKQPVIYVLTHDSIGLGEDGPTHQPVEHLSALRAIPGLMVMRPGDSNEVSQAYRAALTIHDRPTAMVLTRQAIPTFDRSIYASASGVAQGGYILADCPDGLPDVILIGTGSELSLAFEAYQKLTSESIKARLVSLPCWELFDLQDEAYQESVLPSGVVARVAVEAAVKQGWERYLGQHGRFVGMTSFGASAPAKTLYEYFGITAEAVVAEAKAALAEAH